MGYFDGGEFDNEILTLIEPANAVFEVDLMPFIDIETYDQFILSRFKKLRKEAEKENSYAKAYEYVCATNVYIDDRRRFIDLMAFSYADRCPNKRQSFKRNYGFASTNFRALFEHFIHAHELLFRSTPTPADFNNPENSKKENPDKE